MYRLNTSCRSIVFVVLLTTWSFEALAANLPTPSLSSDLTGNSLYRPSLPTSPARDKSSSPGKQDIDIRVEPRRGFGLSSGCNVFIGSRIGGFGSTEINLNLGNINIDC